MCTELPAYTDPPAYTRLAKYSISNRWADRPELILRHIIINTAKKEFCSLACRNSISISVWAHRMDNKTSLRQTSQDLLSWHLGAFYTQCQVDRATASGALNGSEVEGRQPDWMKLRGRSCIGMTSWRLRLRRRRCSHL